MELAIKRSSQSKGKRTTRSYSESKQPDGKQLKKKKYAPATLFAVSLQSLKMRSGNKKQNFQRMYMLDLCAAGGIDREQVYKDIEEVRQSQNIDQIKRCAQSLHITLKEWFMKCPDPACDKIINIEGKRAVLIRYMYNHWFCGRKHQRVLNDYMLTLIADSPEKARAAYEQHKDDLPLPNPFPAPQLVQKEASDTHSYENMLPTKIMPEPTHFIVQPVPKHEHAYETIYGCTKHEVLHNYFASLLLPVTKPLGTFEPFWHDLQKNEIIQKQMMAQQKNQLTGLVCPEPACYVAYYDQSPSAQQTVLRTLLVHHVIAHRSELPAVQEVVQRIGFSFEDAKNKSVIFLANSPELFVD